MSVLLRHAHSGIGNEASDDHESTVWSHGSRWQLEWQSNGICRGLSAPPRLSHCFQHCNSKADFVFIWAFHLNLHSILHLAYHLILQLTSRRRLTRYIISAQRFCGRTRRFSQRLQHQVVGCIFSSSSTLLGDQQTASSSISAVVWLLWIKCALISSFSWHY